MENLYHTTGRIEQLKQRVNRCVCKFCGKQISLYRIIFSDIAEARVELYCDNCGRIEFGIEPEIYHCACNFVDNLEFDYYEGMDDNIKKRQMNIAKVCEILAWGCKNMGILNQNGFKIPLDMKTELYTECMVLSSTKIDENKELPIEMEEGKCLRL